MKNQHITDIFVYGRGKTKEDAFLDLINGVIKIIQEGSKIEKREVVKIKIEIEQNKDWDLIVVDGINELIYLIEEQEIIPFKAKKKEGNDKLVIEVNCYRGELINPIKAATFHDLEIKKEDDLWKMKVLLDV